MNRYLLVFESLGFLLKTLIVGLSKILTPVLKPFIFVTPIFFKFLAKPGYGNSIQFVNFMFFEFSSGDKVAKFCFHFSIMPKERRWSGLKLTSEYLISPYLLSIASGRVQKIIRCSLEYAFDVFCELANIARYLYLAFLFA